MAVYNAHTYGATGGNASNDDALGIQKAIDACSTGAGGIVLIPAGRYFIKSPIRLTRGIEVRGEGWESTTELFQGKPGLGTWLHVVNPSINVFSVNTGPNNTFGGHGTTFRDLAISNELQNPTGNVNIDQDVGWVFDINGHGDHQLLNIFLLHPEYGVRCGGSGSGGRVLVDGLFGYPLKIGLLVRFSADVSRFNNIHFYSGYLHKPSLFQYTRRNALALVSERNDNAMYSNIFCFEYRYAMLFREGKFGITSKFRVSNMDADYCQQGIRIENPNKANIGYGVTGQVSNFTFQGTGENTPENYSIGLANSEDTQLSVIQLSNFRTTNTYANGIRFLGRRYLAQGTAVGNVLLADNVFIHDFNQSGAGFPGIEVGGESTTAYIGGARHFANSNGAVSIGIPTDSNKVFLSQYT